MSTSTSELWRRRRNSDISIKTIILKTKPTLNFLQQQTLKRSVSAVLIEGSRDTGSAINYTMNQKLSFQSTSEEAISLTNYNTNETMGYEDFDVCCMTRRRRCLTQRNSANNRNQRALLGSIEFALAIVKNFAQIASMETESQTDFNDKKRIKNSGVFFQLINKPDETSKFAAEFNDKELIVIKNPGETSQSANEIIKKQILIKNPGESYQSINTKPAELFQSETNFNENQISIHKLSTETIIQINAINKEINKINSIKSINLIDNKSQSTSSQNNNMSFPPIVDLNPNYCDKIRKIDEKIAAKETTI